MFLQFSKLDTGYKTKSEKYYYAKPWAYGVCATTTNFMYKICEFIKSLDKWRFLYKDFITFTSRNRQRRCMSADGG